ncbi:MAG: type II secretion system protein [Granulosicoccus sp.]
MRRLSQGFSLLEMIAVLAISSILAGSLAPSLIRSLELSHSESEAESLKTMATVLIEYVMSNKRIPSSNPSDWGSALAVVASVSPANLTHNQRNYSRALFFDPLFLTNTESNFSGFTQNLGLLNKPPSPRILIISNLAGNTTSSLLTSLQFNAIWNQTNDAGFVESKTIKIERVNLAAYFHQVLLSNQNSNSAAFSLDLGSVGAVPPISGATDGEEIRHIIKSTQLRLHAAPYPSGPVQTTLLVNSSQSFSYTNTSGSWSWRSP